MHIGEVSQKLNEKKNMQRNVVLYVPSKVAVYAVVAATSCHQTPR